MTILEIICGYHFLTSHAQSVECTCFSIPRNCRDVFDLGGCQLISKVDRNSRWVGDLQRQQHSRQLFNKISNHFLKHLDNMGLTLATSDGILSTTSGLICSFSIATRMARVGRAAVDSSRDAILKTGLNATTMADQSKSRQGLTNRSHSFTYLLNLTQTDKRDKKDCTAILSCQNNK